MKLTLYGLTLLLAAGSLAMPVESEKKDGGGKKHDKAPAYTLFMLIESQFNYGFVTNISKPFYLDSNKAIIDNCESGARVGGVDYWQPMYERYFGPLLGPKGQRPPPTDSRAWFTCRGLNKNGDITGDHTRDVAEKLQLSIIAQREWIMAPP